MPIPKERRIASLPYKKGDIVNGRMILNIYTYRQRTYVTCVCINCGKIFDTDTYSLKLRKKCICWKYDELFSKAGWDIVKSVPDANEVRFELRCKSCGRTREFTAHGNRVPTTPCQCAYEYDRDKIGKIINLKFPKTAK